MPFATALPRLPQDPAAADGSPWQWLLAIGREPGVVEVVVAATLVLALLVVWWRVGQLVGGVRRRDAVDEYLFGVEQALHGDLAGARARLEKVLQRDPENHYARLLLGKVLARLGAPDQAHQQHLYLQRAFGIASVENDLLLAQSLLANGLPREAAATAAGALQRTPDHLPGLEFLYRAYLQDGDFAAAAVVGRRLLARLPDGSRRRALRADLAQTLGQLGQLQLAGGDAAAAHGSLREAQRLGAAAPALPWLAARLDASAAGVVATARALLAAPAAGEPAPGALVVAARGAAPDAAPAGLPRAELAGLPVPGRFGCRACGGELPQASSGCPRCGQSGSAVLQEPLLVAALPSPGEAMDAIDENDAYLQRLCRQLVDGDAAAVAAARQRLLELRERAVPALFGFAWQRGDAERDAVVDLLRAMGPGILPALFAASEALEQQRLLPLGQRSPAALVGRIVQGFDRAALPHVESLFARARPEHRKILIDFFLGLADLREFQLVLERFPPLEILHRLHKADAAVLRRFLQAVPPGHFVAEVLLLEPTFAREEEVLAAIPGAPHPEVLERVLLRRGPTRTLTRLLIGALADAALSPIAERLLHGLGAPVLDHVLAAYADPERPPEERLRLAAVLQQAGAAAVPRLCASFAPEPSAFDDDLHRVLVGIGAAAVAPLQAAYGQSGWLERVTVGLLSRDTNRRAQIVRALAAIGGPVAQAALGELLQAEREPNLRLLLQRARHGGDGGGNPGGGDGEAR